MADPLAQLLADGVIEEVVARLKSGKEADIFLVVHAGEIVAAKVYKERHARNFHNNAAYKEGRRVRNSRTQRAMDKGSRFGQAAAEEAWKATESDALHQLFAAGVRVPKPVMFYEGVLLMEAVIDPEGHPAPRLIDAPIDPSRAGEYYADLRAQMIKILLCDLIHGDLSPYNVLLAWNGPTVIDFPQVVGAAHNNQAEFFFSRDLNTIRRFFGTFDPSLNARASDAREIWRAYERRELTPDYVPTGKLAEPAARREFVPGKPGPRGPHEGRPAGHRGGPPGVRRQGGPAAAGGGHKPHGGSPGSAHSPGGGHGHRRDAGAGGHSGSSPAGGRGGEGPRRGERSGPVVQQKGRPPGAQESAHPPHGGHEPRHPRPHSTSSSSSSGPAGAGAAPQAPSGHGRRRRRRH